MFVETVDQCIRLVRPRSFAALMALYEGNYTRLRQLFGNLQCLPQALISSSLSDSTIQVIRGEVSRYTTDFQMTYWLEIGGQPIATPDLRLRVYHDARLAEALSCSEHVKWKLGPGPAAGATALAYRWSLNILLSKWMEHCLDHRHRFGPMRILPTTITSTA